MYAKIGPYRNRWISKVHENYMDKKYGYNNWDTSNDFLDKAIEKLEQSLQWVYNNTINLYLDSIDRKVKVRIDHYDIWSMDHTLSYIILPMLKELKKNQYGTPFVDNEDVPDELKMSEQDLIEYNNSGKVDDLYVKRWEYVLDEMIFSFETLTGNNQDWESQFVTGDYDFKFEKNTDDKLYTLVHGPNHTATVDWEGRKKYAKRIQNGFILFGKYYQSLWT